MAPTTTATTSKSRLVPTRPPSVISMSTADLRSRSATDSDSSTSVHSSKFNTFFISLEFWNKYWRVRAHDTTQ
ncbi:hypothetical protein AB1N83_008374 [Pleurotus pulmonarius]